VRNIFVNVDIPAVGQSNEFAVPPTMAVKDVITLMVKILISEYGVSGSLSDLILFVKKDGKALKMECSLSQLGIADGDKLVLM
jgi:uncharacterized ubiquitin-like protein YukD